MLLSWNILCWGERLLQMPFYLVDSLLVVTSEQQSPCDTVLSPHVQPEVLSAFCTEPE